MTPILAGAFLLLAPTTVADQEPTANELYETFARQFASVPAIEVSFRGDAPGRAEPIVMEYRLGRPLFGSFHLELGDDVKDAVADGKALSFLDPIRMEHFPTPNGFRDLPLVDVLTPLRTFLSGGILAPKSASFAPEQPQHSLLRVLKLEFSNHTEKLWIAEGKKLLAAVVVQKIPGGGEMRYDMIFDRCVALPDAKPQDYKTVVPQGYKAATSPESSLLVVGAEAPNVSFTDVDGNEFDLESLRGKTVLLNFWFLLCPPCRAELPQLNAMWTEIETERGDDVVVLCVNKDDQREAILEYWMKSEFSMTPVLQKKGAVDSAFGVRSWPTNYVIGPDGRVRYVSGGWDAGAVRRMLSGGK